MAQNLATRTVYPSSARTADPSASILRNSRNKGIQVIIDVTAVTDTPSLTINIEGADSLRGEFYLLLKSAAITSVGTTVLRVEGGATPAVNTVEAAQLPRVYRILAAHADADSITYSVGANLVI